jgi:hypothetical protein
MAVAITPIDDLYAQTSQIMLRAPYNTPMLELSDTPLTRGLIRFRSEEQCHGLLQVMKETEMNCLIEDEEW